MPAFQVFVSNRLEILADYLVEVLKKPLPSPLDKEIIVVQSKGMERWVSITLAKKFGVWGNSLYPFPNKAVSELIQTILPETKGVELFDPKIMTWRIMKLLPDYRGKAGFESLKNYLDQNCLDPETGQAKLKRFQLAERLANLFDHYTMFRPDWILAWEKGEVSHWQAKIWQDLTGEYTRPGHRASLRHLFLERLAKIDLKPEGLPKRLSIFGIPSLPSMHMDIFAAIAKHIEVNLFLMNPCRHYWSLIVSEKAAAKMQHKLARKKPQGKIFSVEELHLETGHPMLASLGKQGACFLDQLIDLWSQMPENVTCQEETRFFDPTDETGDGTLLSCLQSDILNLRNRGSQEIEKKLIASDDLSIQVHVCHSPMREIEVLYDHLLDLFQRKPDLEPRDILVMTPDIETYAPYIMAVFEGNQGPKIPYSLADRSIRKKGEMIEAFLKILGLQGSRFTVTEVMDILEATPIKRRFELEDEAIECIRRWVESTCIRWGIDGKDRARLGIPEFTENSWEAGLERLLLGYALPGKGERMFGEILPYDDIEGHQAQLMGRFIDFVHKLFRQVAHLKQSKNLSSWSETLQELLSIFFETDENTQIELEAMQNLLRELKSVKDLTGFDEEIELEIIRYYLSERLNAENPTTGFITGGITFCTMQPMRSIPFRVVMMAGMNDNTFPRTNRPLSFDLMTTSPRRGDPSKRDEDRYLFLETILSVREELYFSYVGQSIKDNSQIPPSSIVSELLDTIEAGFNHPHKKILDHLIIYHRLQAFSPAYFQPNGPLFSYSEENYQALCRRSQGLVQPKPFICEPLPEMEEKGMEERGKTLKVEDLIRFLSNPAKFFLNQRLGLELEDIAEALEEREPFEVAGLARYQLEQGLVKKRLNGYSLEECYPLIRAQGLLPPGTIGRITYRELCAGVEGFVKTIEQFARPKELPPLDVDLQLSGFRLIGRLDGLWPQGLLRYRRASVKARDYLSLWIEHLVLSRLTKTGFTNRPGEGEYPDESLLIATDGLWRFGFVEDTRAVLEQIFKIYSQGMRLPIPFFPKTSMKYAEKFLAGAEDETKALALARQVWQGDSYHQAGEAEDPYFQLCFGKVKEPLDDNFKNLAVTICKPLLSYRKKVFSQNGSI